MKGVRRRTKEKKVFKKAGVLSWPSHLSNISNRNQQRGKGIPPFPLTHHISFSSFPPNTASKVACLARKRETTKPKGEVNGGREETSL